MKRHFLWAVLFGLLAATAVLAQTAPTAPAPKLVMASTEHNLGEVKKGATATYTFTVKNEGKADLEIRNVAPSWGCSASDFTKVVPPGQEGKITLSVNTAAYNGSIVKTADVFTNDPQRAQFTLMLTMLVSSEEVPKGTTVGSLLLSPVDRWSTTIPLNVPATGAITIFNNGAQPLQIKNVSVNGEAFKVALVTLEAGKRYQLSITSSEKLAVGNYKAVVKVETDSTETPLVEIPVSVQVVAPISANPAKLMFDNLMVSNPDYDVTTYGKFTWVRFARGEGLELKSLTSDLPFIKVKVESVEGNNQTYLLRVTFSDRPKVGTHTGTIKVETNNKDVPVLEIPVTVIAK